MAEIALDISMSIESQHKNMEMAVSRRRKYMTITVEKSGMIPEEYDGPYNVVPSLYIQQVLETKNKAMRDNVSVDAIPIYEVTNPAGGRTVTIGSA